MEPTTVTDDATAPVDKTPRSNLTSLARLPIWLITSVVLLLASVVSLIYLYLRGSKSTPQSGKFSGFRSPEPAQPAESVRQARDTVQDKSAFTSDVGAVRQAEQKRNAILRWLDAVNDWSLPDWTPEQIKQAVFAAAGPGLALVIAYFAQGIFDSTKGEGGLQNWTWLGSQPESSRLLLGAGVYLVSILIWVFTAPAALYSMVPVINRSDPAGYPGPRYHPLRFLCLVGSISLYFVAVLLFVTGGEDGFVRGLWATGVFSFVLSQFPRSGVRATPHPEAEESPRFRWQNWLALAIILGAAFWLRFYQLATIPDDLHGDMASHGQVARDFMLGTRQEIFGFGWTATPTIGFLPAYFTMSLFGNNIFGLQMAAVIGGVFSILAIYLLTWRLFNSHRLATITAALVAINVAHIHFSRIFNMEPWPLSNFAIFLFIDGLKARRSTSFGLAGVFLGFSLLMYTSGKVLPFILLVFLVYVFFARRAWIIQNKRGLVLMVVSVVITMGPALVFYLMNWDIFVSRGPEVYIFSPGGLAHLLNKYNTGSPFGVLLTQIKLTLLMFNQTGDTSSQFGYPHPLFSSLVSPLILLGLGFALRRWKDIGITFVLIWLGMITVLGGILTIDAPFWPRLIGLVPAAALLAAVAFDQILELGKKILGAPAVVSISLFIAILLVVVGYSNWNEYYLAVKHNGSPQTMAGRYIGSLPPEVTACGLLSGPQLTVRETYFLAWPHRLVDVKPDAPDSDLEACTGSAIVWVISPENTGRLDAIRARWPNGIVQSHAFPGFNYTLTFYLVGVAPPTFPTDESPDLFPWLLYGIYAVITLIVCGGVIGVFFRTRFPKISHERQTNKPSDFHAVQISQKVPRRPGRSVPLSGMFAAGYVGLNKWYDEVSAFKFPAISPRLIVSTLLALAAVGLAYFAQTILDQPKSDGLHFPVDWLSFSSEDQRLAIACIIFLIAALLWIFTTIGRKNDST